MGKISLQLVAGNSYYCSGVFAIGVYLKDGQAILIDSGADASLAKQVKRLIEQNNCSVYAIINTHCHGDHCGGNASFQQWYPDIRIFSTYAEKDQIQDPDLAPRCFCNNATGFSELRKSKQVTPQKSSVVTDVISPYKDQSIELLGEEFQIITLPGHTPGMIGIVTPDKVLYCGDAIFGRSTFDKHKVLFYTGIRETRSSFQKLQDFEACFCVLYHGGVIDNHQEIAREHDERIVELTNKIYDIVMEPMSIDKLTQRIINEYQINANVVSFTLTRTAITAHLAYLQAEKLVEFIMEDGIMQAHTVCGSKALDFVI